MKKFFSIILIVAFLTSVGFAYREAGTLYTYNATVVNVVDGDTFDLIVDLGFRVFHKVRIRLLEIDTPEKRGSEAPLGNICKDFATELLLNKQVKIVSEKEDEDLNTDSFGRWLCYLWIDGTNIIDIYNEIGINKKNENYSELAVMNLGGK